MSGSTLPKLTFGVLSVSRTDARLVNLTVCVAGSSSGGAASAGSAMTDAAAITTAAASAMRIRDMGGPPGGRRAHAGNRVANRRDLHRSLYRPINDPIGGTLPPTRVSAAGIITPLWVPLKDLSGESPG